MPERGLATQLATLSGPGSEKAGAGSDDIGDVSWNLPTVRLRYPSNIPDVPAHNWAAAISMATPIAHKGATAGAKVIALTMIDLLTKPELVEKAWTYFRDVQTMRCLTSAEPDCQMRYVFFHGRTRPSGKRS